MDNKKYIILEIIPSSLNPKNGNIIQLSALKLNGLKLEDRFDYRLNEKCINNIDLLLDEQKEEIQNIIDNPSGYTYDKDMFTYVNTTNKIMMKFKKWVQDYDLLIIDNQYTLDYLNEIKNEKESIFKYLNMTFSDDIIERVIDKYNLIPSNHIVDLLYEALINESNN